MDFDAFRSRFSLRLDDQQEAAVRQTEGPVLLLAVPGSGKTTALISRIGCLLYCREIDPRAILTMTYTVAATNDMRRRYEELFGTEYSDALEFRTINGVCAKIIRQYEQRTGRTAFQLITEEGESGRLLRESYARCGFAYPSESEIEDAAERWWDYWRSYWQLRGTPDALAKDWICEVTIPINPDSIEGK